MKCRASRAMLAPLTIAVLATMVGAGPFQNGSFEVNGGNQIAAGWDFTTSGSGHTGGVAVINRAVNGPGSLDEGATDGLYAISFNPGVSWYGGRVSQTFETHAGGIYAVAFDYGNYGNAGIPQGLTVRVKDGDSLLSGADLISDGSGSFDGGGDLVLGSGVLVARAWTGSGAVHGSSPNGEFCTYRFSFVAASAISTLVFTDAGVWEDFFPNGNDGVLDNVRVVLVSCPCRADFDGSGGTPDVSDVDTFFTAWLAGDETADTDCSGGTPDAGDIDTFFAEWLAGGC